MSRRMLRLGVVSSALAGALVLVVHRSSVQAWMSGVSADKLIGRPAPELPRLDTLDGGPAQLAPLRGRVVLLHFWTFH
jgi:hypothetical protein